MKLLYRPKRFFAQYGWFLRWDKKWYRILKV